MKGDNLICGTTSTGTGTLTLTEPPAPPGGIGLAEYATATGNNFVNGNAILTSYTIIEYTSATFATALKTEKGIGTLTIGTAYGGGTPHTLARTTIQSTATAMSTTPVPLIGGTAVSIGTAANTLVFIGASAADIVGCAPYVQTAAGDNLGAFPSLVIAASTTSTSAALGTQVHSYVPFIWEVPMLVKKISVRVEGTYSGGNNNLYGRIYAKTTGAQPGKLLIDFGVLGTANSSFASNANISSAVHGSGYFLTPGEYWADFLPIFAGGSGSPTLTSTLNTLGASSFRRTGFLGGTSMNPHATGYAFSDSATTGPDPAFLTSWGCRVGGSYDYFFTLAAS